MISRDAGMHVWDWLLALAPLLLVLGIGIYTQRYMKSVAGFMSGGRVAGRYLLAVAKGEMQSGAVVFVALFEVFRCSGFTLTWWQWLQLPVGLLVAISGFVVYRYRETRVMTLAQFFEIRYSKRFRVFTGILGFLAGILNFGIIPAVGARFFVYFLGWPAQVTVFSVTMPTYIPLMAAFLGITLVLTLSGGLITVMITDCVEGMLSQVIFVVLIVAVLSMVSWSEIAQVLAARPPGQSLLNPFDSSSLKDFNLWYVLMLILVGVYGTMAWQNASAYNSAAATPHESRMGGVLGRWREMGKMAVVTLLAAAAITFLEHPDFVSQSQGAWQSIGQIEDVRTRGQMEVPLALAHMLPVGIKGLLCAVLLMGVFGGDSTHLHSWGGIFVQDVIVPLRRKPFEPKEHIRALRLSIIGVAAFAFLFGCLFQQTEYIVMWWAVTTAFYVGGAGAAIIGGLYWKKGTTSGAWAALLTGSTLSGGGILLRQLLGEGFPLNGMQISFIAALASITLYVVVSCLTCRQDFDLDRMLHRGKYADESATAAAPEPAQRWTLGRCIGFDRHFTTADKWMAGSLFGWGMMLLLVFLLGSAWNWLHPWPVSAWAGFWHVVGIGFPVLFAVVTGVWFTWGGLRDIRRLFHSLAREKVNPLDDGTVLARESAPERDASAGASATRPEKIANNL